MNFFRYILLLLFATTLAPGQAAPRNNANQSEALVRGLYVEVVAHHPNGFLTGAEMKIIAPYLSKALLRKISLARACSADWDLHNPEPNLKSQMASQYGLFSGEYEYGLFYRNEYRPVKFRIDSTQPAKDGSFHVYVSLTSAMSYERPWTWRVAPIVVQENGHLAVNDIIYLDDNTYDNEADRRNTLLSQYLAAGCNGPRWIGPSLPNQPEAFVQSLYDQVLARAPGGIPEDTDWKVFAPYMSGTLQHKIDMALSCEADWFRKHEGQIVKAPFGTSEMGIFSGANEETSPRTFHVERTEKEKDGFIRVYVTLGLPQYKMTWPVAVTLMRENGRLVIEDVIYLKDEATNVNVDYRLSQALSSGCDGRRWVGFDHKQK